MWHEKYGVNHLGCICALDRATLPTLLQYWVPEVEVTGITELVGNALIFPDEMERTTDLRDRDLVGFGERRRKPGRKRNNMDDYKNEFGFFAERPKVEKKLYRPQ